MKIKLQYLPTSFPLQLCLIQVFWIGQLSGQLTMKTKLTNVAFYIGHTLMKN